MSRDIIRPGFSSSYDVDAMKFAARTYVDARLQGYAAAETPPSREDIAAGRPALFQYEEHRGWYSAGTARAWYGNYLSVTALIPDQFAYPLRQTELNRHADSLVYEYVESSIKSLLSYAEKRNASTTRSDVNLSFARNRIIVWLCDELQEIAAARTNDELLRRLAQLHYFLHRCTIRANVENFFPESSKDHGANGFPAKLSLVKRKVEKMQQVITSAMEMKSLGEMFEGFGASLATAVSKLSGFGLYFIANDILCKVGGRAGTTFDIKEFYRYNVSSGTVVGSRRTARGSYEPALANSALGDVLIHFHEMMQKAHNLESFENRFLEAVDGGRETNFAQMASYILQKAPEDLPGSDYVWSGFFGREFFPLVLADGTNIDGKTLPADIMRLFGYLLEAAKVAQQFKKSKATANFMGDYNMVYNAHMHWGLQSLLVQWTALKEKIDGLTKKLSGIRSVIVDEAPKAKTPFHANSPIMISELAAAMSAFDHVSADRRQIDQRLTQLRDEGYLQKQCEEAEAFVSNASGSAKALFEAGVLSESDYRKVEQYKPETALHITTTDIRDPLTEREVFQTNVARPGLVGTEEVKGDENSLALIPRAVASSVVKVAETGGTGLMSMFGLMSTPAPAVKQTAAAPLQRGESDALKALERDLVSDEALLAARFSSGDVMGAKRYKRFFRDMHGDLSVVMPLFVAAYHARLASECSPGLKPPFNRSDYHVLQSPQGYMMMKDSTAKAQFANFSSTKLLAAFGTEEEKLSGNIEAMLGRYAYQLRSRHKIDHRPDVGDIDLSEFMADDKRLQKDAVKRSVLQATRVAYWQKLVALEQGVDRVKRLLEAIRAVTVYAGSDGAPTADWLVVDRLAYPEPGHAILGSSLHNLTDLMRKIREQYAQIMKLRAGQYDHVARRWSVPVMSKDSFKVVADTLNKDIHACEAGMAQLAGLAVGDRVNVTIGGIKQAKLNAFKPLKIDVVAEPAAVTKVFGKTFNVAMLDGRGQVQQGVRFESPATSKVIRETTAPDQAVIKAIFNSSAFTKLAARIKKNQAEYDGFDASYRKNNKHTKLNYLIIGAGKAAAMQSFCNELMVRMKHAMQAPYGHQAGEWAHVYRLLGGAQGDFDAGRKSDCMRLLRSDALTFRVRLSLPSGDFAREDTEVDCATHRHGNHAGINARNYWGMRGNASLPATSKLLVEFVKVARKQLDKHLAHNHGRAAAATDAMDAPLLSKPD